MTITAWLLHSHDLLTSRKLLLAQLGHPGPEAGMLTTFVLQGAGGTVPDKAGGDRQHADVAGSISFVVLLCCDVATGSWSI